ncbi:hypothetical protein [Cupriavidus pinatubonensis]|uniref:Uncharacterized protein n=1 Tax=Cupriavidus pinatubonensis TaxID=248026 RepID=A0ABN7ZB87_9BURK|nr:hypothetical protein [Cupriavidus pinatubonensis]CAG9183234.1 hypothetical protein LMG23994_05092 [Cupriavidus pinatubonensis]
MSQQDYKTKCQEAALVEMDVRQYADQKLATVESGNVLKSIIKIIPDSKFPNWATTLAKMLCTKPELANLGNKELVALIENDKGETGLNHTILSKDLSAVQRHLAGEILRKHGYATDTLIKGTDIKRIVKNNIRTERLMDDGVIFFADGLSINGKRYQYKQRECTPAGNPWMDFCIRMSGQDIKLKNVLILREIGIGEFQKRDEAARDAADPDQLARRQKLDREPKQTRRLTKFISADSPNRNGDKAVADFKAMPRSNSRFEWTSDGLMAVCQ